MHHGGIQIGINIGFGPQYYGGGGFNARGFYPNIWGGANQLFGMPCMPQMPMMGMPQMPMMGMPQMPMCMPQMGGMGGGMEMMMLMMLMMQMSSMSQRMPQAVPNNYPPTYRTPPNIQQGNTNPQTGIGPGYVANNGQTYSRNQTYGPTTNSIGDGAAANFFPEYKKLQEFGRANGSTDGTFVTKGTSVEQDTDNLNKLTDTMDKAGQEIADLITKAPPQQKAALQEEEKKINERIAQLKQQGINVGPTTKLRMQAESMDRLFKEGKVSGELGTKNRAFIEMMDMGDRALANMSLKMGQKPGADIPQWAVDQSPFNPDRKLPANGPNQPQAVDPKLAAAVDRMAGANATAEQKQQMAASLSKVPVAELAKLEKAGVKLRVMTDADFDAASAKDGAASTANSRTLGYFSPGRKEITVRASEIGTGVLGHEVGHALSDLDSTDSQKEVEKLYQTYNERTKSQEGKNPWQLTQQGSKMWSGYARTSAEEYRAEGFSMYHNSEATRNILKAMDPALYAFIEAHEQKNQGTATQRA